MALLSVLPSSWTSKYFVSVQLHSLLHSFFSKAMIQADLPGQPFLWQLLIFVLLRFVWWFVQKKKKARYLKLSLRLHKSPRTMEKGYFLLYKKTNILINYLISSILLELAQRNCKSSLRRTTPLEKMFYLLSSLLRYNVMNIHISKNICPIRRPWRLLLPTKEALIKPLWNKDELSSNRGLVLLNSNIINDGYKLTTSIKSVSPMDNFCFTLVLPQGLCYHTKARGLAYGLKSRGESHSRGCELLEFPSEDSSPFYLCTSYL